MEEKELDITAEPLKIEFGSFLYNFIMDEGINKRFQNLIENFRIEVKQQKKIEIPAINFVNNTGLSQKEYRIIIYGKIIADTHLYSKDNMDRAVFYGIERYLRKYLFYFDKDFLVTQEDLEALSHCQSREAYRILHYYYSTISPDKKKAFHWLKKLSYYGCDIDIQLLILSYRKGFGCEKDSIQAEKLESKYFNCYTYKKNRF